MEARGVIFNIQKFSIHDGPGVRTTVFMKGCPLRCKWCSNPESQLSGVQIMYDAGSCVHCLHCTQSCPAKAVTAAQDGRIHIDFHKCTGCLVCVQSCPGRALTVEGEYKTVSEITGIDFSQIETDEEAREAAIKYGMDEEEVKEWTRGKIIAEMFDDYCEDYPGLLDGPVFLTGHPVDISPLAKKDPKDPRITRRFEAYINGWELSNAFSELNDPIDQYERFAEQQRELDLGIDDEAHPMDRDFVNALEVGMPPTGGIGIGIDRLVMFITNSARDVQLFPVMKPIGAD